LLAIHPKLVATTAIKTSYTQYLEHLQSGTSIAIGTLLTTTSDLSYHSGHKENIMKDYLHFDEDSEDASISPETVSIAEIIADLQHEKTKRVKLHWMLLQIPALHLQQSRTQKHLPV